MHLKGIFLALIITFACTTLMSNCATDVVEVIDLLTDVYETTPNVEFTSTSNTLFSTRHAIDEQLQKTKKFYNVVRDVLSDASKKLLRAAYAEFDLMNINVSSNCLRHVVMTFAGLKRMKLWALKMVDASGGLPKGFFSGTMTAYGDFEGCKRIKVPDEFRGKYCVVQLVPPIEDIRKYALPAFVREESGRDKVLEMALDKSYQTKASILKGNFLLAIRSGICVPSTCSVQDINSFIEKISAISGTTWNISADHCKTAVDIIEFTPVQMASISAFAVILTLVAIGTIYDLILVFLRKDDAYREESGLLSRIALCFSMHTNTKRILKTDVPGATISAFHGVKVFATSYVLLIHTYSTFFMGFSTASLLNGREWAKSVSFGLIVNGNQAIEAFFYMSAVLLVYNSRGRGGGGGGGGGTKGKTRTRDTFLVQAARRYWRLMPSVMLLFAFGTLIPHLADGPEYHKIVNFFLSTCNRTWWTTLIFINNYIDIIEICMPWLWYISVDMHLYICGAFLLAIIRRFPRFAYWIIGTFLAVGLALIIGNTFYFKIVATPLFVTLIPAEEIMDFLNNFLMRSHLHVVPYAVGMAVGYYLRANPKLRMHWLLSFFFWISSLVMATAGLLGVYEWNQGNLPTLPVSAIYNCGVRLSLSVALGWLTIACCTGNGGFVQKFLSWAPFVPLGRLTFMVYLIHPMIQVLDMATIRFIPVAEHQTIIFRFMAYLICSYAVSFLCALWFEYPFAQLDKLVFPPSKSQRHTDGTKKVEHINGGDSKVENSLSKDEVNGDAVIKTEKLEMIA